MSNALHTVQCEKINICSNWHKLRLPQGTKQKSWRGSNVAWHQSVAQHTITCNAAVFVTWRCKDISPGVHLQSPGLLQLSFVRRHRQLTSTTAVCTERCRQVIHVDRSPWTHLTCSAGIALGCLSDAVSTSYWCLSSHWCLSRYTARIVVSLRRVQVGAWGQSPSPLVWRHHMRHTMVQNSSGQQVVWCRWTAACFTAVIWQSLPI